VQIGKLLGGLTAAEFLDRYWQKRPLLIRNAIPGFELGLDADELAGLACTYDAESRLILEKPGGRSWEVRHGPFEPEIFRDLPDSHWTLLVQDVEKHVPRLAALLGRFRFVPDWRVDDLMVSYAAAEGSVGPHVDQYDVFLLQASGRRRWRVQSEPPAEERLVPGLELRILENFDPDEEWLLGPGDMLYLPPGIPHHGVAAESCLTCSIGFRSPGYREMLSGYLDHVIRRTDALLHYADPDLRPQGNPGEITPNSLERVRNILRDHLSRADESLDRWFGAFITEPKERFQDRTREASLTLAELRAALEGGQTLLRDPASRLAYIRLGEDSGYLYANGTEYPVEATAAALAETITAKWVIAREGLDRGRLDEAAWRLLTRLVNEGHLYLEHNDA